MPLSLTSQVPDQRIFTGVTPEWSDSEEPAQVGTCDLPVIKGQVLGLLFSTAIFRTLPIEVVKANEGRQCVFDDYWFGFYSMIQQQGNGGQSTHNELIKTWCRILQSILPRSPRNMCSHGHPEVSRMNNLPDFAYVGQNLHFPLHEYTLIF